MKHFKTQCYCRWGACPLRVPEVTLMAFLTGALLTACAQMNPINIAQSSDVTELLTYEGQELLSLEPLKREHIEALINRIRGRILSPAYVCSMRAAPTSQPYVVYFELPLLDGWPGINRLSATVMDSTGFAVTPPEQREFFTGSRTKAFGFHVLDNPGPNGLTDVLAVDIIRGGPNQSERGKDFYVLSHMADAVPPRLLLIRREDGHGRAVRLTFTHRWHDHERLMDYAVPVYDEHISWRSVLEEEPLAERLAAMLFLNSHHDYETDRKYQHELEAVPQYLVQAGVVDALLKDESPWMREYAAMLIEHGAKRPVPADQPK